MTVKGTKTFEDVDFWKAIILYGLNQATYKIALGKTLLQLSQNGEDKVEWEVLSKYFLDNYIKRLSEKSMPQQATSGRLTVMERIIINFNSKIISYDQAVQQVAENAFNDVIPRFQTIGTNKEIVFEKFYHFDHGKKLYLHDSIFLLNATYRNELDAELDARWSLLEGAFMIGHKNWTMANDIREIYLLSGYGRTNITPNIPFLMGYQGNVCFYCGEVLSPGKVHVDHVLPRQVVMHDEIWNLVLSHDLCNLHKDDALIGKHYMDKLIARNENIMGSNHPWKKKISQALGITQIERARTSWYHYENTKTVLNGRYWEHSPHYNRETDPFFKKLITQLNNQHVRI